MSPTLDLLEVEVDCAGVAGAIDGEVAAGVVGVQGRQVDLVSVHILKREREREKKKLDLRNGFLLGRRVFRNKIPAKLSIAWLQWSEEIICLVFPKLDKINLQMINKILLIRLV